LLFRRIGKLNFPAHVPRLGKTASRSGKKTGQIGFCASPEDDLALPPVFESASDRRRGSENPRHFLRDS
jgi:hypothetical protein